jgi:hypothetical protein
VLPQRAQIGILRGIPGPDRPALAGRDLLEGRVTARAVSAAGNRLPCDALSWISPSTSPSVRAPSRRTLS